LVRPRRDGRRLPRRPRPRIKTNRAGFRKGVTKNVTKNGEEYRRANDKKLGCATKPSAVAPAVAIPEPPQRPIVEQRPKAKNAARQRDYGHR
jgi:hypothetical protein